MNLQFMLCSGFCFIFRNWEIDEASHWCPFVKENDFIYDDFGGFYKDEWILH